VDAQQAVGCQPAHRIRDGGALIAAPGDVATGIERSPARRGRSAATRTTRCEVGARAAGERLRPCRGLRPRGAKAVLGDILAQLGVDNGCTGVVIHGAARDVAALAGMPIGIKALGSNPRKSDKTARVSRTSRSPSAGPRSTRGDQVWSHDDGVVVLRPEGLF
jgi:hypothetical protein